MKNAESTKRLLWAMSDFSTAYSALRVAIEEYEQETKTSVNLLEGFTESYPFDKSFDELAIGQWVADTIKGVERHAFKVLNYNYLNTGGNTMVGIFEVWLPAIKKVVYALTNEEGCTLAHVDFISNELEVDDYDELIIECVDWGRVTGFENYFELYRYCLNEYTKSDCKYFGYTRQIPFHLLSVELQEMVDKDYLTWCELENGYMVGTDGVKIIVSPDYEETTSEDKLLEAIKEFKRWHDTTAGVEKYYSEMYKLEFAGHKIELPFMADIWDAVDTMLVRTIQDW